MSLRNMHLLMNEAVAALACVTVPKSRLLLRAAVRGFPGVTLPPLPDTLLRPPDQVSAECKAAIAA